MKYQKATASWRLEPWGKSQVASVKNRNRNSMTVRGVYSLLKTNKVE